MKRIVPAASEPLKSKLSTALPDDMKPKDTEDTADNPVVECIKNENFNVLFLIISKQLLQFPTRISRVTTFTYIYIYIIPKLGFTHKDCNSFD